MVPQPSSLSGERDANLESLNKVVGVRPGQETVLVRMGSVWKELGAIDVSVLRRHSINVF